MREAEDVLAGRPARPRVSARIARGLRLVLSIASCELDTELVERWPAYEVQEARDALRYIEALCTYIEHGKTTPKRILAQEQAQARRDAKLYARLKEG